MNGNEIKVSAENTLSFIKREFSLVFPFLRLEFFYPCRLNKSLKYTMQADAEQPLKQYRKGSSPAEIIISPAMTVGNLEERFNKTYGLGVHVLRKSGKAWLETTRTNNWTLQEQNKQGEFLSNTLSK